MPFSAKIAYSPKELRDLNTWYLEEQEDRMWEEVVRVLEEDSKDPSAEYTGMESLSGLAQVLRTGVNCLLDWPTRAWSL